MWYKMSVWKASSRFLQHPVPSSREAEDKYRLLACCPMFPVPQPPHSRHGGMFEVIWTQEIESPTGDMEFSLSVVVHSECRETSICPESINCSLCRW